MNQETSKAYTSIRAPKAAAIAGIIFSMLLIISLVIILISVPAKLRYGGGGCSRHAGGSLLAPHPNQPVGCYSTEDSGKYIDSAIAHSFAATTGILAN